MGFPLLANIWIFLHFVTFISFISSIILSFKNPFHLKDSYVIASILHIYTAFLNLRGTSAANGSFLRKIFLDYSVHIVGCNLIFIFLSGPSFSWSIVLGFLSFYQILNFLVCQILPNHRGNKILEKCQTLYQKMTNPPYAPMLLATMEIMCLMPSPNPYAPKANTLLVFTIYLFWHVLYRYSVDNIHKQIWGQLRQKIATLAYKLPAFLRNIIMSILNTFSQLGTLGCQIYHY